MLWALNFSILAISVLGNPGTGIFALYYSTSWETAYLHYNPDNSGWNSVPGDAFGPSSNSSFPSPQWKYLEVAGNSVVFVTTNGQGAWDNNGGQNYKVTVPGLYSLQSGSLKTIETFPPGCPGSPACSGHGTCDSQFKCHCDTGFGGPDCSITCAPACAQHGTCDSSGKCICNTGWASCNGAQDCSTNVQSDNKNCGGCGILCSGDLHSTATCISSKCNRTCDSGYNLCSDNTCQTSCGLPGCNTYSDNQCQGDVIITPPDYEARRWQTPARGEDGYRASYQDWSQLQGHAQLVYSSDHKSVTVNLVVVTKNPTTVSCMFDGQWGENCSKVFTSSTQGPITVSMKTKEGATLQLDPVDFMWAAPAVNHSSGDYRNGQKGSIIEMFGWPHADIAKECAFAAKAGYLGVKVFPAQEQVMSVQPMDNVMNPWYFMYQPVSYRLQGRMGTRDDLRAMIKACRSQGVRVYADAVVNHMTGGGNDADPNHRNGGGGSCTYWPGKNTSASFPPQDTLMGSSYYETQSFKYKTNPHTNLPPSQEFPAVPYGPTDFHCERALNSWTDPLDLNAGWLSGLVDLNTEKPNVQQRIADYFTDLLSIGFSGFRIDAAKHMQPTDIAAIFGRLKSNLGGVFPDDFISWLEVLLGGEADLLLGNPTSPYSYSKGLENALAKEGLSSEDINKIKIWYSAYPKEPSVDNGQLSMVRKAIQNDDADQQNSGSTSRDMGDQGSVLVVDRDPDRHRQFEVKLFANPNGATDNNNDYPIRMVLSSYYVKLGSSYGIPDGFSDCSLCKLTCESCQGSLPKTQAYQPDAQAYVGPVYTYVHRDTSIVNAMRAWMKLPSMDKD